MRGCLGRHRRQGEADPGPLTWVCSCFGCLCCWDRMRACLGRCLGFQASCFVCCCRWLGTSCRLLEIWGLWWIRIACCPWLLLFVLVHVIIGLLVDWWIVDHVHTDHVLRHETVPHHESSKVSQGSALLLVLDSQEHASAVFPDLSHRISCADSSRSSIKTLNPRICLYSQPQISSKASYVTHRPWINYL